MKKVTGLAGLLAAALTTGHHSLEASIPPIRWQDGIAQIETENLVKGYAEDDYTKKAEEYFERNEHEMAKRVLKEGIRKFPYEGSLYYNHAVLCLRTEQYEQAGRYFLQFIQREKYPASPELKILFRGRLSKAYTYLALIAELGDTKDAIRQKKIVHYLTNAYLLEQTEETTENMINARKNFSMGDREIAMELAISIEHIKKRVPDFKPRKMKELLRPIRMRENSYGQPH